MLVLLGTIQIFYIRVIAPFSVKIKLHFQIKKFHSKDWIETSDKYLYQNVDGIGGNLKKYISVVIAPFSFKN